MAESKVVSIRIPQDLLNTIDRLAAIRYPSRRPGGTQNRSQMLLDFIMEGVQNTNNDTVNYNHTVANEAIETRLDSLVDEKLTPIQEKLAVLEEALGGTLCLRAENQSLRQELETAQRKLAAIEHNKEVLQQLPFNQALPETSQTAQPNLNDIRDRILSKLKVGKQSPEYKRTKAVIDSFINELLGR